MQKLYTLREVADHLRISYWSCRRWRKEGRLQCIKLLGGALRVSESELVRILDEGSESAEKKHTKKVKDKGPVSCTS